VFVVHEHSCKGRESPKITRFSRRNRLVQRHVIARAVLSNFSPIRHPYITVALPVRTDQEEQLESCTRTFDHVSACMIRSISLICLLTASDCL